MSNIKIKGVWELKHIRDGKIIHEEVGENVIPYEGMNRILNALAGNTTLPNTWYINLFKNNVTPALSDTASSALGSTGTYGECTDADLDPQTNRIAIVFGTASSGSISSSNTIQFTARQNLTVYGGFVTNTQAKLDNSGVLLSAKKFSSARSVLVNDIIQVTVTYMMTSA